MVTCLLLKCVVSIRLNWVTNCIVLVILNYTRSVGCSSLTSSKPNDGTKRIYYGEEYFNDGAGKFNNDGSQFDDGTCHHKTGYGNLWSASDQQLSHNQVQRDFVTGKQRLCHLWGSNMERWEQQNQIECSTVIPRLWRPIFIHKYI